MWNDSLSRDPQRLFLCEREPISTLRHRSFRASKNRNAVRCGLQCFEAGSRLTYVDLNGGGPSIFLKASLRDVFCALFAPLSKLSSFRIFDKEQIDVRRSERGWPIKFF